MFSGHALTAHISLSVMVHRFCVSVSFLLSYATGLVVLQRDTADCYVGCVNYYLERTLKIRHFQSESVREC
jgi:hypothetical protein